MKTTVIWVLRHLLIPVGFIWATGIFTPLSKMDFSLKGNPNYFLNHFDSTELATLEINLDNAIAYGDSLIKERKRQIKETGFYDPYLYFRDLKQYEMFEKVYLDSINNTPEKKYLMLSCISGMGMSYKSQLVNLRDENWRNLDVYMLTAKNYEQSAEHLQKSMSIAEAKKYWFPSETARELASTQGPPVKFWSDIAVPFLTWLEKFYFKGFPFAFFLFLIWRIKFKKDIENEYWGSSDVKKPELDFGFAPLSFLISVLLWPVILWMDIRNRWSETLRRTEMLSRRKNMFSLLSKPEKKLVEIGRRMSLKEFRIHLDSIAIKRKHSFTSAFIVTISLIIIPRVMVPVFACNDVSHNQTVITNTDYGGAHHDDGHSFQTISFSLEAISPPEIRMTERPAPEIIHFYDPDIKVLSGFLRKIIGVPKVVTQAYFCKLSY